MTVRIALLRAINVGGTGKLAMADLRAFFGDLGFGNARTLIQTGNVVFECDDVPDDELESYLETEASKRLALGTAFIVRAPEEWDQVIAANPFPDKARDDPRRLYVMALKAAAAPDAVKALEEGISGPERVLASGKHLYIDYPDGAGKSKLTSVVIERKLETRGTARNWNTVLRLSELAHK